MKSFNILHLSDLQFGNSHSTLSAGGTGSHHDELCATIAQKLRREGLPGPDAIILSGDVVERGHSDEFDHAFGFVSQFHQALVGNFRNEPSWIVVPGNHDVNREASKANAGKSECERRAGMLQEYNVFVSRVRNFLRQRNVKIYSPLDSEQDFRIASFNSNFLDIVIAPLDSCEREGHLSSQHFGFISPYQLEQLDAALSLSKNPWTFQIAVLHHHVALSNQSFNELKAKFARVLEKAETIDKAKIGDIAASLAAGTSNHLIEPERVLKKLAGLGFQLVLHGHQHYDGPIHVQFPTEDENPFGHGGLSIMAAGSLGIGAGGDQPSTPSFQFYQIQRDHFGWKIISNRFRLATIGSRSPGIDLHKDPSMEWNCYSTRPRKILSGLCNFLSQKSTPRSDQQAGAGSHTHTALNLAWGYCFSETTGPDILLGCKSSHLAFRCNRASRLVPDWTSVVENSAGTLDGVMELLTKQKVYADLDMWGLSKLERGANGIDTIIELQKTKFLPYVAINLQLNSGRMGSLLERLKGALTNQSEPFSTLTTFLGLAKQSISTRLTLNVLIEVHSANTNYVLLKRRSTNVSLFEGMVQFSVAGGFKCGLEVGNQMSASRDAAIEAKPPDWIVEAFRQETLFETGISIPHENFRMLCLTLSSSEYSPVLTAVATIDEHTANIEERPHPHPTAFADSFITCDKLYFPKTPARDWWEGTHFLKGVLPVGTSLLSRDLEKAKLAWSQLQTCWERNPMMDPTDASVIKTAMNFIESKITQNQQHPVNG